jgi:hypothetical protein
MKNGNLQKKYLAITWLLIYKGILEMKTVTATENIVKLKR